MRESITLQVGQCGNQIGNSFWQKISTEHGLDSLGNIVSNIKDDNKNIFFYETDSNQFVPRSILVDLEPRVVNDMNACFYNKENMFIDSHGGGAGNNWAFGYCKGREHQNSINDMIQREVESCDNLESFMLFHSIAGGTGSGFGSLILESVREMYPKKIIQAYSVFPNNQEVSDVVVQPYNSVLTLKRLALCCDSVLVMDNTALTKINSRKRNESDSDTNLNYSSINSVISDVIAASTSTFRFPSYLFPTFTSLHSILHPLERLKFIIPSYTPFNINSTITRKTDCNDIMRRLLLPMSRLASTNISQTDNIISMVSVLSGMRSDDVQKAIYYAFERENLNFVSWMPPSFHVVRNSIDQRKYGLGLNNTTSVNNVFVKVCEQFDMLKKKNAFTDIYKKFDTGIEEFDECRNIAQNVIDAYNSC